MLLLLLFWGKANHGGLDKMMSYEGSNWYILCSIFWEYKQITKHIGTCMHVRFI